MTTHAAASSVHTQIVVDAPVERAFQVFTEDFGAFKPSEHNLLSVDIAERTSALTGRSRPILTNHRSRGPFHCRDSGEDARRAGASQPRPSRSGLGRRPRWRRR
jgi:hypothetical protein